MCYENADTFDIKIISRSYWMWFLSFFSQLPQIASEVSRRQAILLLLRYIHSMSLNPNFYQSEYLFSSPYKGTQLVHTFLWQAKLLFDSRASQLFSVGRLTLLTAWMTSLGNAWTHEVQPTLFQPFAFNRDVVNARNCLWKNLHFRYLCASFFPC